MRESRVGVLPAESYCCSRVATQASRSMFSVGLGSSVKVTVSPSADDAVVAFPSYATVQSAGSQKLKVRRVLLGTTQGRQVAWELTAQAKMIGRLASQPSRARSLPKPTNHRSPEPVAKYGGEDTSCETCADHNRPVSRCNEAASAGESADEKAATEVRTAVAALTP